ncbi:hypothetical protein BC629DRAFT_784596 [Irpex lacteus]|nr:hypothetical protein BC629DRAFT_784596 [Irpex lacteus]
MKFVPETRSYVILLCVLVFPSAINYRQCRLSKNQKHCTSFYLFKSLFVNYVYRQAGLYVGVAFFALYFFDSIATFPQEVKVIWRRKWTVTTWLYAFTRYTTLIFGIQSFIPIPIRVLYALLNAKVTVPAVVFFLNMVPFVMNLYVFVCATAVVADNSCRSYFTLPANVVLK